MKTTPIIGRAGQSVRATRRTLSALSLAALGLAATGVQAAPVNVTLCAQVFAQPVTTTVSVPMWGYSLGACGAAAPSAPGPVLTLAPGDGPLVVTLINNLPVPTSLVLAGQGLPAGSAPVFATDVQDAAGSTICTPSPADTACRVRSFTTETPAGGTQTYTFNNLRSGTYLYQSGTHPQVQVQMGLFGMAKQDAAAGQLFAGRPYALDVPIVLSEIDPDMHQRIADTLGTAGNQAAWKATNNSTLTYSPKYFLINGKVFDGTTATDLPVATFNGANVVLRLANAGLQSRSLMLNGGHWSLLTEDGFPYPAPREQYTALLPAGKTTDAMIVANVPATGTNASLAIFDRRGGTHNADGGALGGQVARLAMSNAGPAPNQPPVVNAGADQNILNTAATANLAGSVTDDGVALPLTLSWSMVSGPGSVTFTAPNAAVTDANFSALGVYTLRLTASDTEFTANDDVVVRVNAPPLVNAGIDQTVNVAAAMLTGTASDDGAVAPLTTTWSLVSGPAGGTVTLGSANALSSSATFSALGTYTMRLTASDGQYSVADDVQVTVNAGKHIGDLDGASANILFTNNWGASVTIVVHNALHQPVNGVTVSGTWSAGTGGTTSCVTLINGTCIVLRGGLSRTNTASVSFAVTGMSGSSAQGPYTPANNHDPDSGAQASNGTSIVVPRP